MKPSISNVALAILIALTSALGFIGCSSSEATVIVKENGEAWPSILRIAYTPSRENPEGRVQYYKDLAAYLSSELGIAVEIIRADSYGPTIEAMRADKIDVASGGSFTYLIAHEKSGAQAIAMRGTPDGQRSLYNSIIATSPKTGIKTFEQLAENASEYTFAFTDPASTSGHLVPRNGLTKAGIHPENDFDEVVFAQEHINVVMATVAGKVDAGAMSLGSYWRYIEDGRIEEDDLHILWTSRSIPQSPIFLRRELPEGLKYAIQAAYLDLHVKAPELMAEVRKSARNPNLVYLPATDDMWDELRRMAYEIDSMTLLTKK